MAEFPFPGKSKVPTGEKTSHSYYVFESLFISMISVTVNIQFFYQGMIGKN